MPTSMLPAMEKLSSQAMPFFSDRYRHPAMVSPEIPATASGD